MARPPLRQRSRQEQRAAFYSLKRFQPKQFALKSKEELGEQLRWPKAFTDYSTALEKFSRNLPAKAPLEEFSERVFKQKKELSSLAMKAKELRALKPVKPSLFGKLFGKKGIAEEPKPFTPKEKEEIIKFNQESRRNAMAIIKLSEAVKQGNISQADAQSYQNTLAKIKDLKEFIADRQKHYDNLKEQENV